MDDFHLSLARIGLSVLGDQGFVLGGGHAIELHGIGNRPSEDIDLFTLERGRPAKVASDLVTAYEDQHLAVNVTRHTADLVQMLISDDDDRTCKVDVGVLWRGRAPVVLDIGPVLHPDDAVASKMDALFNRTERRHLVPQGRGVRPGAVGRDNVRARRRGVPGRIDRRRAEQSTKRAGSSARRQWSQPCNGPAADARPSSAARPCRTRPSRSPRPSRPSAGLRPLRTFST